MTDRPIIFSGPMIAALLSGRKSQTRRVLRSQPSAEAVALEDGAWRASDEDADLDYPLPVLYAPGDRLWVREAHAILPRTAYRTSVGTGTIDQREHPTDGYSATVFREGFDRSGPPRWRPSIHMPRWASRLTLHVTDVRVQRLQEISETDARAEGVDPLTWPSHENAAITNVSYRKPFRDLWNNLHGDGAWADNPWVVALTFTVERANIDAFRAAEGAA